MLRGLGLFVILFLFAGSLHAQPPAAASDAAQQYESLLKEFKEQGRNPELVKRFMDLARDFSDDPAAVKALGWVVVNVRDGEQQKEAMKLLLERHADDEGVEEICASLIKTPSLAGEQLLKGLLDKSSHASIRAVACYYLAEHLREQARLREAITAQPAAKRRFEQFYGKEFTAQLLARDPEQLSSAAESHYDRVVNEFPTIDDERTADSRIQLNEIRHLAVGKPAMEIEGEAIHGERMKLSDHRGKVVVLTFWGHW